MCAESRAATHAEPSPGSTCVDVAILVLKSLKHDSRVLKESETLAAQGLDVVRVGVVTHRDEPEWERTDHDRILLVHTTNRLASQRETPPEGSPGSSGVDGRVARDPYAGVLGAVRHWLGRRRENRLAAKAVALLRPRVVIACDLNTLLAGWLLKRETGCRLVYDAHELYTEMSPAKSWAHKLLWGATERRLIRKADAVITVSPQRAEEFARRYRIPAPGVVLNGPRACLGNPQPVGDPIRIIYQGGFQRARGIDSLIRASAALRGKAIVTLQGFGSDGTRLRQLVESHDLQETVRFIEPCAPELVVPTAHEHDVGVVTYRAETLNDYLAAPNKLFDYMGAGIAVLGTRLPMIEEIVTRERCGVLFSPDDEEDLAHALAEIVADRDLLAHMKTRSARACERYAWQSQEATLLEAVLGVRRDVPNAD